MYFTLRGIYEIRRIPTKIGGKCMVNCVFCRKVMEERNLTTIGVKYGKCTCGCMYSKIDGKEEYSMPIGRLGIVYREGKVYIECSGIYEEVSKKDCKKIIKCIEGVM